MLPKIHKIGTPLRPIVSSRGAVTYGLAKEMAYIIWPLVGQSPHHIKTTQQFVDHIKLVHLLTGEAMVSYDMKVLSHIGPGGAVQNRLHQDPLLPQRTFMSISQIIILLEFCLKNIYFLFQGGIFKQVHGVTMGSSISPLIVNLFLEEVKVKAISSVPHSSHLWLRYVDDTFVIQQAEQCYQIHQHINYLDPYIHYTTTDPKEECSIPFLDTLFSQGPNTTLTITVCRNTTHMDQYLQWGSNYFLEAKHSIYNFLTHRLG